MFESNGTSPNFLSSTNTSTGANMRETVTWLVVENLLSPADQLKQCSAILCYNIAYAQTMLRDGTATQFDEEWVSEFVAAVAHAISEESGKESINEDHCMLN
jgi:PUL domain